jgi:uncharacterized cupredoxin-like copper-binding protein
MKNRLIKQILISLFAAMALNTALHAAGHEQLDCVIEPGMVVDLSSRIDGILGGKPVWPNEFGPAA